MLVYLHGKQNLSASACIEYLVFKHVCQGLNSHYFHIIGDKLINPIVGVYIPIIRIPIKGGRFPIPNIVNVSLGVCVWIQIFS